MAKKNGDEPRTVKFWLSVVSGIIGICITVGGVVFTMETRYAKAAAVDKKIELVSNDILKTIQQDRKNSNIKFYQQLVEQTRDKIEEILQRLQFKPNDEFLKSLLQQEKNKLEKYQNKLDDLLK